MIVDYSVYAVVALPIKYSAGLGVILCVYFSLRPLCKVQYK